MASRNRVTPTGEIVLSDLWCEWMGNRGCLHDDATEIVRPWRTKAWITCRTSFKERRVEQWAPGRYTVLFFHDEAVALAAGHRPCAECRRADYNRFLDAWETAHGTRPSAPELDEALHAARLEVAATEVPWDELPKGALALVDGEPVLVTPLAGVRWDAEDGYTGLIERPYRAVPLTPAPVLAVLRAGYRPQIDSEVEELLAYDDEHPS